MKRRSFMNFRTDLYFYKKSERDLNWNDNVFLCASTNQLNINVHLWEITFTELYYQLRY